LPSHPAPSLFPYTTLFRSDLASWRGAPVVLNLWYAACPPCRTEAPALQANFERFHDDGVQFLGLNVRDGVAAADAFSKTFKLTRSEEHTSELQSRFDLVCR